MDGQVETNSIFLAIISPFLRLLLQERESQSSGSDDTCSSCVSKTHISVPGLPSKDISSFLSSLVEGGKDVFASQDLQRVFFPAKSGEVISKLESKTKGEERRYSMKEELEYEGEEDENEDFKDTF